MHPMADASLENADSTIWNRSLTDQLFRSGIFKAAGITLVSMESAGSSGDK